ncbi:MAG: hypothetical protein AAGF07_03185 [Patescibacteria group bacterium]
MFRSFVDQLFPRFNIDYTDYSSYLSDEEIKQQSSFYKILDTHQQKYLDSIFVASNLRNELILDLVNRSKLGLEYAIATDFARLIIHKVRAFERPLPEPDFIAYVPADPTRLLQRGYHLPQLIARELVRTLSIPLVDLVLKTSSTATQTSLDRKKRLVNLKDKFKLINPTPLNLANFDNLWIVDDITTTGATMVETAKVIKRRFPFLKINGVVVASNSD